MSFKKDVVMETQLLNILKEHSRPMTTAEIAHRLQMPLDEIAESIETLKHIGIIREATIEEVMREGK